MEEIPLVYNNYELLGCVVDVFLDCSGIVEDLGEFIITARPNNNIVCSWIVPVWWRIWGNS